MLVFKTNAINDEQKMAQHKPLTQKHMLLTAFRARTLPAVCDRHATVKNTPWQYK
jgi:hypothetical protein